MAKLKVRFVCQKCGQSFPKWQGQCTACEEWNTLVEEVEQTQVRRTPIASPAVMTSVQTLEDVKISMPESQRLALSIFTSSRV